LLTGFRMWTARTSGPIRDARRYGCLSQISRPQTGIKNLNQRKHIHLRGRRMDDNNFRMLFMRIPVRVHVQRCPLASSIQVGPRSIPQRCKLFLRRIAMRPPTLQTSNQSACRKARRQRRADTDVLWRFLLRESAMRPFHPFPPQARVQNLQGLPNRIVGCPPRRCTPRLAPPYSN
jgi:hypothetical protein